MGRLTCNEFGDCGRARFHIMLPDDSSAKPGELTATVVYADTSE